MKLRLEKKFDSDNSERKLKIWTKKRSSRLGLGLQGALEELYRAVATGDSDYSSGANVN